MPLEVRRVEESDLRDFVQIQVDAFSGRMAEFLFPQPLTEEWYQKSIEKHIKCMKTEPDCHFLKVVDTDQDGKMIAAAKWRINEKERTEEQIQGMLPVPGKEEEGRPAAQDFMRYLHRVRAEYMGTKPFFFLHLLVTDPAHQRRGAGAMLVRWGIERADKARLPSYLEASMPGRPLYARLGFEAKYEEVFDLLKYGSEGKEINTVMVRKPSE